MEQLKLSQPRKSEFQIVTAVFKFGSQRATANAVFFTLPCVSLAQHNRSITLVCWFPKSPT